MSQEKEITIVENEEAQKSLNDRVLTHLTNRVNKLERGDVVGELRHAVATRIHQLLPEGNVKHSLIRNIDPAFRPIEHMKDLRDIGQIAIAKDGEKTVGMVGFEHRGIDPVRGRHIYEIRRVGVRKEYEGQKIGSKLHKAMFDRIRETDPNGLILVEAQDPAMKKICERMGYKPCEPRQGLSMQYGNNEIDGSLRWFEESGGQFFLYDPSSKVANAGVEGE